MEEKRREAHAHAWARIRTSEEEDVEQHALPHAAARVLVYEEVVVETPRPVSLEDSYAPMVQGLQGDEQRAP